jgi:hypothetical protein
MMAAAIAVLTHAATGDALQNDNAWESIWNISSFRRRRGTVDPTSGFPGVAQPGGEASSGDSEAAAGSLDICIMQ